MRFLVFLSLLSVFSNLNAQSPAIKELGVKGVMTRAVDMTQLNDGSFMCIMTEQNLKYTPFLTATFLMHLSAQGDSLDRIDIGNASTHVLYNKLFFRNDSLLIQGVTAPDSIVPHYSRNGNLITTYFIQSSPLKLVPVNVMKIETAFSVYTGNFKALNWYYSPALGYDAEICRLENDSGTGYKINFPGSVTVKQLLETNDGGVLVLGDVWLTDQGNNNDLYVLKLDRNLSRVWERTYGLTKGQHPPSHIRPNSERPTYFVSTKVVNGDTIREVEGRMVADTITGHSTELFVTACLSSRDELFLLGNVYGYYVGQSYFLSKIGNDGTMLWCDYSCDSVADSLYFYSAGTHLVPLKRGKCMIVGYRNSREDLKHREIFTATNSSNGKKEAQSELYLTDRWINPAGIVRSQGSYYLFCDHMDRLTNPNCVPFLVPLDKRGRFENWK